MPVFEKKLKIALQSGEGSVNYDLPGMEVLEKVIRESHDNVSMMEQ